MGARRRQALNSVEESEQDGGGPTPMSPNTQKKEMQKRIMNEDLGQANADFITTSDLYGPPPAPSIRIVPKADIRGTEEAKFANKNAAKTNSWRTWGDTDEAKSTSAGVEALAGGTDGNSHRYRAQQERSGPEQGLGRRADKTEAYDNTHSRTGTTRTRRLSIGARQLRVMNSVLSSEASPSKTSSKTGSRRVQERPWPPSALEGTPAFSSSAGANLTASALQTTTPNNAPSKHNTNDPIKKLSSGSGSNTLQAGLVKGQAPQGASKAGGSLQASRPENLASRQPYTGFLSSDPSAFVSSATQFFASFARTQQAQDKVAAQETLHDTKGTSQPLAAVTQQDNSVRKVPVNEFSIPGNSALAVPDQSTHTGGAPSPAALPDIRDSANTGEPTSVATSTRLQQAHGSNTTSGDLVGLGILNVDDGSVSQKLGGSDFRSNDADSVPAHNGSIMDSPILEDVNNDILVAGRGKVIVINGVRYVPESELLALKRALIPTVAKVPIPVVSMQAPAIEDTVSATASFESQTNSQQSSTTDSDSQRTVKANPFRPREPVAPEIAKSPVSVLSQEAKLEALSPNTEAEAGTEGQKRTMTFDEALVRAVRSQFTISDPVLGMTPVLADTPTSLPPLSKGSSQTKRQSNTSASTAISKWAPVAASPMLHETVDAPSVKVFPAMERNHDSILQSRWANGGNLHASSAQEDKSRYPSQPSTTLQPPDDASKQHSSSPIIGDRHAFGHMSKLAATGLFLDPPPARPSTKPKRKSHQPGPGYTALLKDLNLAAQSANMGVVSQFGMSGLSEQTAADDSEESEL